MKKFTLFLIFIITTIAVNAQDTCATALPITAGIHTCNGIDGEDPVLDCIVNTTGNNGEWYTYTPSQDYFITISTDLQQNSGGDTRVQIFEGTCGNFTCIGGDDDSGSIGSGYLSIATFNASAGTTYYIVFDNNWNSAGFDFEITESDPPPPPPLSFSSQTLSITGDGRAVVDMNNDFLDDIVSISSTNVNIYFQDPNSANGFTEVNISTPSANYFPSWSLAAGDYNADGYNDLLYGAGSGVTFMKTVVNSSNLNNGNPFDDLSGFTQTSNGGVFSQRSNFVDFNGDGHLDAFVCHDVEPNVYYINDGSANLTFYQTFDAGAPYVLGDDAAGGNYGSIWVDYDNDRDLDLFIAKCRGGNPTISIDEMYTKNEDGSYTENAASLNLADDMQTWSSAWGDFDNDGDMDVFVGASSGSHKLMRNDISTTGQFTNITAANNVAALTSTSIETTTYDFDNDGNLDLVSGSNVLLGNGDMTFSLEANILGSNRRSFGDINNDGFIDVVTEAGTVYTNTGNDNNWVSINTIGTTNNINGIGARVEVHTPSGVQIRDVRSGDGFRFMSTLNTHFGLGTETTIDSIVIYWSSDSMDVIQNPAINTRHSIVEGSTLGLEEFSVNNLITYPNPTKNVLYVNSSLVLDNAIYVIFDLTGKRIISSNLESDIIDVSSLNPGNYFLKINSNGKQKTQKFIKL